MIDQVRRVDDNHCVFSVAVVRQNHGLSPSESAQQCQPNDPSRQRDPEPQDCGQAAAGRLPPALSVATRWSMKPPANCPVKSANRYHPQKLRSVSKAQRPQNTALVNISKIKVNFRPAEKSSTASEWRSVPSSASTSAAGELLTRRIVFAECLFHDGPTATSWPLLES